MAHNWCQLDRVICNRRMETSELTSNQCEGSSASQSPLEYGASDGKSSSEVILSNGASHSQQSLSNSTDCDDFNIDLFYPTQEEIELEHNVWDFKDPSLIFDSILFNDRDDA